LVFIVAQLDASILNVGYLPYDESSVIGVNPDKIDKIIKEFMTSIKNSQKIFSPLFYHCILQL